jgi:regulator of replication initiation timing
MKFTWSLQTYMFFEGVHICSNKYDEKAPRAPMFLEGVHICSNEFDEKVKSAHMFLSGVHIYI